MALMTQLEFAEKQGWSKQYVHKLVKNGVIKLVNGKVDPEQAIRAIEKNADPVTQLRSDRQPPDILPGQNQQGGAVDFVTARTMREAFRAKLAKLEYEEKSGRLTDAGKVNDDAFKAGRILRDELLGLPDRMADILAAESDPIRIRNLLLEELESSLNRLCVK